MSGPQYPGGVGISRPATRDEIHSRDLYPLPAHSLRTAEDFDDAYRSSIAGRRAVFFLSLCFLTPLILAGIMLRFG